MIYVWCVVCMYNVWLYDIICIWVWLYIWLYGCMSTWIYVLYMCCIIWDCKCGYMYVYGYTGYVCTVCVIWWPQIDIYMCDMILCYDLRIDANVFRRGFERAAWLEFLHVVLNTTCNCIRCYVMWILVLYYVVMCVYVDNSLIYVDNFLLQMQHFYELFWKYYIFVYFHALSLVISRLLLFSHFFIIS